MNSFAACMLPILLLFSLNIVRGEVRFNSRCVDVSMTCKYHEKFCSKPTYAGLMFSICRFTCDWCQKSLNDVTYSNRRRFAEVPDDIREWLTVNPSSPRDVEGSTGIVPSCVDTSRSCSLTVSLCESASYQSIMAKKCKKTCGLCE
ncbi:Protein CBG27015 [Caenorhabditis briggsae]|uniref:Protein CBG27015 n=1 Tax=Caenorhabditis briggsae TaxID=6238 RepID=B6IH71_CAEBR|nr:Protein CBG27015 [Caenorhabditis briggsae]CAR99251.1 Protein CBG27015 [Caenorhabditis briggsae]